MTSRSDLPFDSTFSILEQMRVVNEKMKSLVNNLNIECQRERKENQACHADNGDIDFATEQDDGIAQEQLVVKPACANQQVSRQPEYHVDGMAEARILKAACDDKDAASRERAPDDHEDCRVPFDNDDRMDVSVSVSGMEDALLWKADTVGARQEEITASANWNPPIKKRATAIETDPVHVAKARTIREFGDCVGIAPRIQDSFGTHGSTPNRKLSVGPVPPSFQVRGPTSTVYEGTLRTTALRTVSSKGGIVWALALCSFLRRLVSANGHITTTPRDWPRRAKLRQRLRRWRKRTRWKSV